MLRSKDSKKSENMPGWPFGRIRVKRQVGMIYWYSAGKHEFDIRVLRRVLGLPAENPQDKWFMAKKPNPCKAFHIIKGQIETAMAGRKLEDVIAEHDRLKYKEAEASCVQSNTELSGEWPF